MSWKSASRGFNVDPKWQGSCLNARPKQPRRDSSYHSRAMTGDYRGATWDLLGLIQRNMTIAMLRRPSWLTCDAVAYQPHVVEDNVPTAFDSINSA